MLLVHYPCNTIQALNMGCIDALPSPYHMQIPPRNKCTDVQECRGHTYVWEEFRHMGVVQMYEMSKCMGAYECM